MPDTGRASASSGEPDVGDVGRSGVAAAGNAAAQAIRPGADPAEVGVADVLAAQSRLRRYLPVTPMHHAERFGVMLKLENLQRTGSYKVRGALNAMLAARERGDQRPVICASAGNHAQGVAWAAYRLGVQAITVMPHGAPATKIAGVAHWGATVRQHGDSYDEAYAFARQLAEQNDYRFLSAFDDPDVIAGQGTIGIEIAPHTPDVVIVPIGGGGLASGVALALKSQGVRVVGAQVEGVDSMARAIKGDTAAIDPARTLADGVRVKVPGLLTRRLCARLLDDVVIVREAELRETLVRLALEENLIAEGAGALALAAGRRVAGKRKCAVVSGGNIDAAMLATLLSEVRPRAPRKPRRRTAELVPPDPPKPRPRPLEKRRATATLSAPPVIPAPMAPSAPQPVSEEEFTW
ncbi:threonine dehydratase [Pseudoxanthomonas kaohsiungensis]|uniref:threonine dehydratase n=1 Tax=Pseudoxanthomonas kaohsiungensis TaxID=283923 RepID=UPI0035B01EC9